MAATAAAATAPATTPLARVLYRLLLRELRRIPPQLLSIREPLCGENGSFSANTLAGLSWHYDSLDQVVPLLEVLPKELPLQVPAGLRELVRNNFKANRRLRGGDDSQPYLDQAFAALRALPEQAYLEACSSSSVTDGVVVDVTSSFSRQERIGREQWLPRQPGRGIQLSIYKYRVRITNERQHAIKVLGRGWAIRNDNGVLEGEVELEANAIVGQQPTIEPGECFEYYSSAHLSTSDGSVPSGTMAGELLLELSESGERVVARVEPFRLLPPPGVGVGVKSMGRGAVDATASWRP